MELPKDTEGVLVLKVRLLAESEPIRKSSGLVFSWGGAGQYAVQGVLNADVNPVLGFVVFSAVLSLIIYLVVDLIYFALDRGRVAKCMADLTKPILEISELWVTFPAYRAEAIYALKGIDLRIDPGEFIGLVGDLGPEKLRLIEFLPHRFELGIAEPLVAVARHATDGDFFQALIDLRERQHGEGAKSVLVTALEFLSMLVRLARNASGCVSVEPVGLWRCRRSDRGRDTTLIHVIERLLHGPAYHRRIVFLHALDRIEPGWRRT